MTYPGRRLCDDAYFDRYFAMGVPAYDIENGVIEQAFGRTLVGNMGELTELLVDRDSLRINLILDKLVELSGVAPNPWGSPAEVPDAQRLGLVSAVGAALPRILSDPSRFLDPQERCIRWVGALLSALAAEVLPEAVADALNSNYALADRVAVLHHATRGAAETRPLWLETVREQVAQEAVDVLRSHLRARDGASVVDRIGWVTYFVRTAGRTSEVRAFVDQGLDDGEFGMGDVAARFVTTPQTLGTGQGLHLGDPDQDLFHHLVPCRDDDWFDLDPWRST